jgi:nitrite reductase/ring-hydroxylating ferredoxin subunit
MSEPRLLPFPPELQVPGTAEAPFEAVLDLGELPPGAMTRVSRDDLDLLLAYTEAGLVATDDRCPHMSAPFSEGRLDGCVLHCPLHKGAFDARDGEVVTFPTTGGLDAAGQYRPTWTPEGSPPKAPLTPDDPKARARALTRVRRLRYYPLRVRDGVIEVAWPR